MLYHGICVIIVRMKYITAQVDDEIHARFAKIAAFYGRSITKQATETIKDAVPREEQIITEKIKQEKLLAEKIKTEQAIVVEKRDEEASCL